MSKSFKDRLFPILPKLARDFGTPIHVYDEKGLRHSCELLKAMDRDAEVAYFKEFFAVKACPVPAILRVVKEAGFGFDCSSEIEIMLARQAGAEWNDIMFTSNNTTSSEFAAAYSGEGCIFNLDDISFLEHPMIQEMGFPSDMVCFRVNPGNLLKNEDAQLSMSGEKAKYGIMHTQLEEAYSRARDLGAKRFGLHTMVCSNDLNYKNMAQTVELLFSFVERLEQIGINVEFINMGGGIGIPYRPEQNEFDMAALFSEIHKIQEKYIQKSGHIVSICMESGRWLMGPHGVLVNRAINRKDIYQTHIGVECGMPGLMRPAIYGAYHHISVCDGDTGLKKSDDDMELVNIVGGICEDCDRLTIPGEPRLLPKIRHGEENGDFIVTHECGAHAAAMGFNYNGRPRPGAVMLGVDGKFSWCTHPENIHTLLSRTEGL
jgi:diaminopimelate decarboxylase